MTPRRRFAISTLIFVGYALVLVAVIAFGLFFTQGLRHLHSTTQDLYVHPFAVSNAAASMKGSLFQLRNHMLQIVLLKNKDDNINLQEHTAEAYDLQIRADLEVIKSYFLGDMTRVELLEHKLNEWNGIRNSILAATKNGDFPKAESLIRAQGTPKFAEIVPLVDYVLGFAKNRAKRFVTQAENDSTEMINKAYAFSILMIALIIATAGIILWRVHFLQRELDRQATSDFLTGAPNRRHFINLAEQELSRAQRYQGKFSLAVIDLDFFKRVNDNYGHQAGDEVLKAFCSVCSSILRDTDTLGRIGGEEFAILLPNTALPEANEVIERVRLAVAEREIGIAGHLPLHITASFGLTSFKAEHGSLPDVLREADEALYRAKEAGRNRVICAGNAAVNNENSR